MVSNLFEIQIRITIKKITELKILIQYLKIRFNLQLRRKKKT